MKGERFRKKNVTWYINPASIIQTVVSVFATFKLLDVYSKRLNGESAFEGEKRKFSEFKTKIKNKIKKG